MVAVPYTLSSVLSQPNLARGLRRNLGSVFCGGVVVAQGDELVVVVTGNELVVVVSDCEGLSTLRLPKQVLKEPSSPMNWRR